MKKSLLLLASMLMSAGAFAQWNKPVPTQFVPMADDGETVQYLYNVEAGGFFIGANDYMTRASIGYREGAPVKMTAQFEDDAKTIPLGTWALIDSVAKFSEYRKTFVEVPTNGLSNIWVDNNNGAHADEWIVTALGENKYEITNPAATSGKLTMFQKFDGVANTRLWLFDEANEDFFSAEGNLRGEGPCSTWAFISPEEYNVLQPKMAQYDAAMALAAAIESAKAEYVGINVSDAEAIYNNYESTEAELDSATNKLVPAAIITFQKAQASADKPVDFTDIVPNANFEGSYSGWSSTTGAQNGGLATNRCDNNAYKGTTMTGQFWENWNPEPYSGKMYTQLTGLPAGVYRMKMAAFINPGNSGNVYLNDFKINKGGQTSDGRSVTLGQGNDIPATFEVWGYINDGDTIEIGLEVENNESNWIGIDNVSLIYYGAGNDAYKLWYTTTRTEIIKTMNALVTPDTKYDKTQKAVFEAALAAGDNATEKEDLLAAIAKLQSAADATFASIDAYKALEALCEKIDADRGEIEFIEGSIVDQFFDLMDTDDADDAKEIVEGLREEEVPDSLLEDITAPKVILEKCDYSTERLNKYMVNLELLYNYCVANSVKPGTDYTSFIKDADFTDPNGTGWTKVQGGITWRGGFHAFPVAESYHSVFDFYQEISAPDGVYSLSLNGFCRPDDGETEPAAELYMNEFATKFQSLAGGALKETPIDGFNCYLTTGDNGAYNSNPIFAENPAHSSPANNADRDNGDGYIPDGMEGASIAFSANRYQAKIYGLVEGGKIKLGARCTSAHQWVLWGNFKLTYEGNDEDAMKAMAESFAAPAAEYLDLHQYEMSNPAIEALNNAIEKVANELDFETLKEAVKTMNAELENAKANVAAVAAFQEAKYDMDEAASTYQSSASAAAKKAYNELVSVEYEDLATDAIKEYIAKFNDCATALRTPATDEASDENPVVMTQLIVNADFEKNVSGNQATGWTLVKREGSSGNYQVQNGFSGVGMEFWSNTNGSGTKYDFYQEITKLPAGTYEVTVDAANSYNGQNPGPGEGFMSVYAAVGDSTGYEYTDVKVEPQTEGCADAYNTYSIIFNLAEGQTLRIGSQNCDVLSARWCMIDNFTLTYYGKDSKKDITTEIAASAPVSISIAEIYSVAGARINALQKGINIVKMSNGDVKKIMVK